MRTSKNNMTLPSLFPFLNEINEEDVTECLQTFSKEQKERYYGLISLGTTTTKQKYMYLATVLDLSLKS